MGRVTKVHFNTWVDWSPLILGIKNPLKCHPTLKVNIVPLPAPRPAREDFQRTIEESASSSCLVLRFSWFFFYSRLSRKSDEVSLWRAFSANRRLWRWEALWYPHSPTVSYLPTRERWIHPHPEIHRERRRARPLDIVASSFFKLAIHLWNRPSLAMKTIHQVNTGWLGQLSAFKVRVPNYWRLDIVWKSFAGDRFGRPGWKFSRFGITCSIS